MTLSFDDSNQQHGEVFRGKHKGKVFVTTHRMIFLSNDLRDNLRSFAVAFMYMKDLHVEQPLFGANYISGTVAAHPNGEYFFVFLFRRYQSAFNRRNDDDDDGVVV